MSDERIEVHVRTGHGKITGHYCPSILSLFAALVLSVFTPAR